MTRKRIEPNMEAVGYAAQCRDFLSMLSIMGNGSRLLSGEEVATLLEAEVVIGDLQDRLRERVVANVTVR